MDVSPRELRDTEIKEAFRGYSRDDVDELLERAASTIEGLSERVRQITERIADAETSATRNRDTEDTLQRTLILAQKTADEAVRDAQQRARKLLEDSETKARTVVSEAEATARRIAEGERRRLESEIEELATRRDALQADVEALDQFEGEYRKRLRGALEAELDSLGKSPLPMPSRPTLHDVEVPPRRESVSLPPPPPPPEPEARPAPPEPEERPSPKDELGDLAPDEPAVAAPDWGPEGTPPAGDRPDEPLSAYVTDEPIEAQVLDDDAFFASLREAVRDDAPLGPRDDADSDTAFYDHEEDADEEEAPAKRRFRRRR